MHDIRQIAQHRMRPLTIEPVRPAQQQGPGTLATLRMLDRRIEVHQR
jgi:hypothetical protein